MNLFTELRRRNVIKVGLAYAVASWLLLQIVDLVLENINAPDWVMQVFMLALAVGLPIVLIAAWALELTPDGIKLEKNVDQTKSIARHTGYQLNRGIITILSMAVVLLLTDKFRDEVLSKPEPEALTSETVIDTVNTADVSDSSKSIAVLPFVDMSPKNDQVYFADGISEEILNVLVKTHSLKVAGRTSSFQFRDRNEDLRKIGEQLGVEHILEGSIRKASNRVRITAQLVTASDGFHLWSETYDRELTDIFAIQDEIARAITAALAIELNLSESGEALVKASTRNMEAYDRYLEARGLIAQRSNFPRAMSLLDEATRLDPGFAAGWATNAQVHALSIYYIAGDNSEAKRLAEDMANKALEIDPNLSMAHSVLGDIYRDSYQWGKAQESYLRALSLNPDEIEANEQYAQMLWRANYFETALEYSAKAVRLDPLSKLNLTVNAGLRYVSGDRAGGWADMNTLLQMSGDNLDRPFPLRHALSIALCEGKPERAIEFTKAIASSRPIQTGDHGMKAHFENMLPLLNSRTETLAYLSSRSTASITPNTNSFWVIDLFWAAYYGDYDLAEKIMEAGTLQEDIKGTLDTSWLNYPFLNPLHNSDVYKRLVKKTNLDDFWRENGFPRYCRPIGEDDFACS